MSSSRDQRLVRAAAPAQTQELFADEARVRALVDEVGVLDAEIDALAEDLGAFERAYAAVTVVAFDELRAAERLERRVARLEAELGRMAEAMEGGTGVEVEVDDLDPRAPPRPAPSPRPSPPLRGGEGVENGIRVIDPGELDLKRLHRRLARLLHPDLAREEGDRARAGAIMARVNEAYARRDRAALELFAERLGAGELTGEVDDEARRAHLARRAAALEDARAELAAERTRLLASTARRLRDLAATRAAEGRDLAAEAREAALAHAAASRARSLSGLDRLAALARELARTGRTTRAPGLRRGRGDLAASSALVRGPALLSARRASPAARALSRALAEEAARPEPWAASLAVLAFLGEAAGVPPDALATRSSLEERWDALRAGWRSAPDLGRALARLPRHLELGLRAAGDEVVAGLQLSAPDLAAGVSLALAAEPARTLARRALGVLGPRERCSACGGAGYAVHFLRARGLDEIHGLACPSCAAVLRSFWWYGQPEGLAALAPLAVEVGAIREIKVRFGGALLAFGRLPVERTRFTVAELDRRVRDLLLAPHGLAPPPGGISYRSGRRHLAPDATVPAGRTVSAALVGAAAGADVELLDAVRRCVAQRFRA